MAAPSVADLVTRLHSNIDRIHSTIQSLSDTSSHDAHLDRLAQERDSKVQELRKAHESSLNELRKQREQDARQLAEERKREQEKLEVDRKREYVELMARRRNEDDERKEKAEQEEEEREKAKAEEDTKREREREEKERSVQEQIEAELERLEDEMERKVEEGKRALRELDENRRAINKQIEEALSAPTVIPKIKFRSRAKTIAGGKREADAAKDTTKERSHTIPGTEKGTPTEEKDTPAKPQESNGASAAEKPAGNSDSNNTLSKSEVSTKHGRAPKVENIEASRDLGDHQNRDTPVADMHEIDESIPKPSSAVDTDSARGETTSRLQNDAKVNDEHAVEAKIDENKASVNDAPRSDTVKEELPKMDTAESRACTILEEPTMNAPASPDSTSAENDTSSGSAKRGLGSTEEETTSLSTSFHDHVEDRKDIATQGTSGDSSTLASNPKNSTQTPSIDTAVDHGAASFGEPSHLGYEPEAIERFPEPQETFANVKSATPEEESRNQEGRHEEAPKYEETPTYSEASVKHVTNEAAAKEDPKPSSSNDIEKDAKPVKTLQGTQQTTYVPSELKPKDDTTRLEAEASWHDPHFTHGAPVDGRYTPNEHSNSSPSDHEKHPAVAEPQRKELVSPDDKVEDALRDALSFRSGFLDEPTDTQASDISQPTPHSSSQLSLEPMDASRSPQPIPQPIGESEDGARDHSTHQAFVASSSTQPESAPLPAELQKVKSEEDIPTDSVMPPVQTSDSESEEEFPSRSRNMLRRMDSISKGRVAEPAAKLPTADFPSSHVVSESEREKHSEMESPNPSANSDHGAESSSAVKDTTAPEKLESEITPEPAARVRDSGNSTDKTPKDLSNAAGHRSSNKAVTEDQSSAYHEQAKQDGLPENSQESDSTTASCRDAHQETNVGDFVGEPKPDAPERGDPPIPESEQSDEDQILNNPAEPHRSIDAKTSFKEDLERMKAGQGTPQENQRMQYQRNIQRDLAAMNGTSRCRSTSPVKADSALKVNEDGNSYTADTSRESRDEPESEEEFPQRKASEKAAAVEEPESHLPTQASSQDNQRMQYRRNISRDLAAMHGYDSSRSASPSMMDTTVRESSISSAEPERKGRGDMPTAVELAAEENAQESHKSGTSTGHGAESRKDEPSSGNELVVPQASPESPADHNGTVSLHRRPALDTLDETTGRTASERRDSRTVTSGRTTPEKPILKTDCSHRRDHSTPTKSVHFKDADSPDTNTKSIYLLPDFDVMDHREENESPDQEAEGESHQSAISHSMDSVFPVRDNSVFSQGNEYEARSETPGQSHDSQQKSHQELGESMETGANADDLFGDNEDEDEDDQSTLQQQHGQDTNYVIERSDLSAPTHDFASAAASQDVKSSQPHSSDMPRNHRGDDFHKSSGVFAGLVDTIRGDIPLVRKMTDDAAKKSQLSRNQAIDSSELQGTSVSDDTEDFQSISEYSLHSRVQSGETTPFYETYDEHQPESQYAQPPTADTVPPYAHSDGHSTPSTPSEAPSSPIQDLPGEEPGIASSWQTPGRALDQRTREEPREMKMVGSPVTGDFDPFNTQNYPHFVTPKNSQVTLKSHDVEEVDLHTLESSAPDSTRAHRSPMNLLPLMTQVQTSEQMKEHDSPVLEHESPQSAFQDSPTQQSSPSRLPRRSLNSPRTPNASPINPASTSIFQKTRQLFESPSPTLKQSPRARRESSAPRPLSGLFYSSTSPSPKASRPSSLYNTKQPVPISPYDEALDGEEPVIVPRSLDGDGRAPSPVYTLPPVPPPKDTRRQSHTQSSRGSTGSGRGVPFFLGRLAGVSGGLEDSIHSPQRASRAQDGVEAQPLLTGRQRSGTTNLQNPYEGDGYGN